jgi:hypothetical protein
MRRKTRTKPRTRSKPFNTYAQIIECSGQDQRSVFKFPHFRVEAPYENEFRQAIYRSIPPEHRRWNPVFPGWEIKISDKAFLEKLLERYYDYVESESEGSTSKSIPLFSETTSAEIDPLRELLFEFCPKEISGIIFREASKYCHPDSGGSDEIFKKMISLWEKVKLEFE